MRSTLNAISNMLSAGFQMLGSTVQKQKQCHFQRLATSERVTSTIRLNPLVLKSDCFHSFLRQSWLAGLGMPCLVTLTEQCFHKTPEKPCYDPQLQSHLNSGTKCAESAIVCLAPEMCLSVSFVSPIICFNICRPHKCHSIGVQRIKRSLKYSWWYFIRQAAFHQRFKYVLSSLRQWIYSNIYITAAANNSHLPATTANAVIRNNSKPAKLSYPIHLCQRIDILADIEGDYVT